MAKAHQPLHYPHLEINQRCQNCDNCRLICPRHAIIKNGDLHLIDSWSCNLCLLCQQVCPTSAIELEE